MRHLLFALALLFVTPAVAQDQGKVVASCGSVTLKAGTSAFRTLDLQGQTCNSGGAGGGGGGGGCPEATDYLARTVNGDEGGNDGPITTLICGLVTDGVWSKLDAFYVFAQENQADALLNLKGTSYTLTPITSMPPFQAYVGFGGFVYGIDSLQTGLIPPAANFTQDSASFGVWLPAGTTTSSSVMGNSISTGGSHLYPLFTDGYTYARVNSIDTPGIISPAVDIGYFAGDRSSSTIVDLYSNGVSIGSVTSVSEVPAASQFIIGGQYLNTPYPVSAAHIGAALGAAGNLAVYTELNAYLVSIPAAKGKPSIAPAPKGRKQ